MRVPLKWLHEYCAPELDAQALAQRLALTGTEVERVEHHGVRALENFVVGRVLERRQHPDADRLSVCVVDFGGAEATQIVCGAPNVAAGQTVAVARPGAIMPDGSTLRKAKLRGQTSDGMILAEDELGIGTDHDGIMVLGEEGNPGPEPGTPLDTVLPISTEVLVLEITPNRPDCLGIYGVAREVHAATGAPLKPPPWQHDPGSAGALDGITIVVEDDELCPRFIARILEHVKLGPSPIWMKARLMAAGQRPISNVVDITNYVMLLTGQPTHVFDLDRVAGARLTVRRARAGEQLQTLDGQTRTLQDGMGLIDDGDGPTSIAGVMGGARSEVEDSTTRVLFEAANWDGAGIHRTALALGLRSEASTRFEKQLQPEQAMHAQAVGCQLLIDLCGATLRPGTVDIGGPGPRARTICLRTKRVSSLLGVEITPRRSSEILIALGFKTVPAHDGLEVTVPDFRRADITREADLIEEVARLDGLEKLPATLPSRHGASGRLTPRQSVRRRAADALTARGLHEVVGWSFAPAEVWELLRIEQTPRVRLANPMSAEQEHLRTTLIGSLLDITRRNLSRAATSIAIFEAGAVYLPTSAGELPSEPHHVAALMTGPLHETTWRAGAGQPADFFVAKGVLESMLGTLRVEFKVGEVSEPFLHPGRRASILLDGGREVGWLGEIHPSIAALWDIDATVAAFELDLDAVGDLSTPMFKDLTSFPEVREDLAIVVDDTIAAGGVIEVVMRAGAPLISSARVFDVYRDDERLGAGKVSLALALTYRAPDRTLTDAEVAQRRAAIVAAIGSELRGTIRGG